MSHPLNIIGIAGSLRSASYSRLVLQSIEQLLPVGTIFSSIDIGELPHYNEDFEHGTLPSAIGNARKRVTESDAVVIITPEFNHGLPGVLKNTLDWLSRPAFDSCMTGKPVFFITLSPGALGGVRAQYQMRETLSSMLCQLTPMKEIAITHVGSKVDQHGLTDETTLAFIKAKLEQFLKTVR